MKKRILCALLVLVVMAGCFAGTNRDARSAEEIVPEIITLYGTYGENASGSIMKLFGELALSDLKARKLWKDIVDYWVWTDTELEVNPNCLPENLPQDDSLCMVVLGFALNDDGSMKEELIGRLTTALNCAEQYPNAYVLCTGGGTAKENAEATEADSMGQWLLENGLDESRLILENQSKNTLENAEFSLDILQEQYPQVNSVALVSSDYHIARASLLFEASFLKLKAEEDAKELHVVSNAAYPTEGITDNEAMKQRFLLQLAGY